MAVVVSGGCDAFCARKTQPPGGMASVRVRRTSIDSRALLCVQATSEDVCLWDEKATSQSQSGKRDKTVRAALMIKFN